MLKKEFKRKDVERMRNLIKGNSGDSTEIQIGYSAKQEDHKEGDVWEEGGKTWTIKDGIKQTHTKLDRIKKEAIMPLFCPECGSIMKKQSDPKLYKIHKKCTDCVVEMEHKLRIEGKYKEYQKTMMVANMKDHATEMEAYLLDAINLSNEGFVSENGEVERWKGGLDKEHATQVVKDAVKHFNNQIDEYAKGPIGGDKEGDEGHDDGSSTHETEG
jgi:hypothetical protein